MSNNTSKELSAPRPKLLVSVRDSAEIETAVQGGTDWIDLKEPSAGPLAGVSVEVAQECVKVLAGRRPLSAALGELCDWPNSQATGLLEVPGVEVVKLGLAGCAGHAEWQQDWLEVAQIAASKGKLLAAVIYADWEQAAAPSPEEILTLALSSDCRYLLIDTFDKSGGGTLDYLPSDELEHICQAGREGRMQAVLAGSLSLDVLEELPLQHVDMVAVRGAVCRGDRTGSVELRLVEEFQRALASCRLTTRNAHG